MPILAVNAGSSSLKFALYPRAPIGDPVTTQPTLADPILTGHAQGLEPGGTPRIKCSLGEEPLAVRLDHATEGGNAFDRALATLRRVLDEQFPQLAIEAVAHRVVHGGSLYRGSVLIDDTVLAEIERLSPLAPLHQPAALDGVRLFRAAFPGVPQVACFDTAFHATLPEVEFTYALPRELSARHDIRRYGFHGLSYQFVVERLRGLSDRAGGRMVLAHLGSGASLCATLEGKSRATTMGFTPLDGLMMGTRSGALDPGIVLYLLREEGWNADQIEGLLYRQSGLLGVSGRSADLRELDPAHDAAARLAIDLFCRRVARETAALAVAVGGLDVLAFTGGIGEHRGEVRAEVCRQLVFLGIAIDADRNRAASGASASAIHADGSAVEAWVVPTDEGRVAASEAARLVAAGA